MVIIFNENLSKLDAKHVSSSFSKYSQKLVIKYYSRVENMPVLDGGFSYLPDSGVHGPHFIQAFEEETLN